MLKEPQEIKFLALKNQIERYNDLGSRQLLQTMDAKHPPTKLMPTMAEHFDLFKLLAELPRSRYEMMPFDPELMRRLKEYILGVRDEREMRMRKYAELKRVEDEQQEAFLARLSRYREKREVLMWHDKKWRRELLSKAIAHADKSAETLMRDFAKGREHLDTSRRNFQKDVFKEVTYAALAQMMLVQQLKTAENILEKFDAKLLLKLRSS